jgi:hypothetical protein
MVYVAVAMNIIAHANKSLALSSLRMDVYGVEANLVIMQHTL